MRLSDLQDEWSKDSKIDATNIGDETLKTPNLHSKYLAFLANSKLLLRKQEVSYWRMRKLRYRYFRGELTKEELEENEWPQWQGTKPLKNEMDEFLTSDDTLLAIQDKIEYYKTVVVFLEQVMRSLNSRTWDIKNHIEYLKYSQGGY